MNHIGVTNDGMDFDQFKAAVTFDPNRGEASARPGFRVFTLDYSKCDEIERNMFHWLEYDPRKPFKREYEVAADADFPDRVRITDTLLAFNDKGTDASQNMKSVIPTLDAMKSFANGKMSSLGQRQAIFKYESVKAVYKEFRENPQPYMGIQGPLCRICIPLEVYLLELGEEKTGLTTGKVGFCKRNKYYTVDQIADELLANHEDVEKNPGALGRLDGFKDIHARMNEYLYTIQQREIQQLGGLQAILNRQTSEGVEYATGTEKNLGQSMLSEYADVRPAQNSSQEAQQAISATPNKAADGSIKSKPANLQEVAKNFDQVQPGQPPQQKKS